VLRRERLAGERVGEDDVVVVEDRERYVRRVALLGVLHDVPGGGARLREPEDLLDRDTLPLGVELRPSGHAVDVGVEGSARKVPELVPGETERAVDLAPDAERPRLEVHRRDRAVVEDRELLGQVLAGRQPLRDRRIHRLRAEQPIEHGSTPSCAGHSRGSARQARVSGMSSA